MTKRNLRMKRWIEDKKAYEYNMYMLENNYGVRNNLLVK